MSEDQKQTETLDTYCSKIATVIHSKRNCEIW